MEQTENKDQKRILMDEMDYIDIPSFFRSMMRYVRKYILFVLPLIICMSVCLAVLSRSYTKKYYVSGGTSMIGLRLSDSYTFDYTFSGLTWERQSTLTQMDYILNALTESGYITLFVKDSMGIKRNEELNGQIYMNAAYSTNLVDIYVVSDSPEDAEAIRDAVFTSLPDAVFPAMGPIEMNIEELYTREESSSKAFLASPIVWAAGGVLLGIIGYLGLIFLYTLRRKDVETPKDLSKLTDLPCLGRLPVLKKRIHSRKRSNTEVVSDNFIVTKEYQRAFDHFRRNAAEEIQERQIKVLLLTGIGHKRGQTTIAAELEKAWLERGKKVVRKNIIPEEGPVTEEKVRYYLNQYLEEAELVLIDGTSCDQSTDALILADCADAMIVVIREGQSQPDEIKEMFQSLQYVRTKTLGYVLNICSNTGN